jgi:hypothetical protein
MAGSPYRRDIDDPRIESARQRQVVRELAEARVVEGSFQAELELAQAAVREAVAQLYAASYDGPTRYQPWRAMGRVSRRPDLWAWLRGSRRPDPQDVERARRELDASRVVEGIAAEVRDIARARVAALAAMIPDEPAGPAAADPDVDALAITAGLHAAAALAREAHEAARDAAKLVAEAQQQEMVLALGGVPTSERVLDRADLAVAILRCRIGVLRAGLVSLDEKRASRLDGILEKLVAAGTGPGQQWKDLVSAATSELEPILDAITS